MDNLLNIEYNEHLNEINLLKNFLEWLNDPGFKEEFENYAEENPKTKQIEIRVDKINDLITTLTIKMKFDIWESENDFREYAHTNNLKA